MTFRVFALTWGIACTVFSAAVWAALTFDLAHVTMALAAASAVFWAAACVQVVR